MPRRFNWKQEKASKLVDEYLAGKIVSVRQLHNRMRESGLHVSKNTVYSLERQNLRKRRNPRISLLAVPKPAPLKAEKKGHYRIPWQTQPVLRILDSYITYKEKTLREVGHDIGALYSIPPVKKEALKNHVLERRRVLNERYGPGNFKKFDRLNFCPTDDDYYDLIGLQACESIDGWFKKPSDYVKWDPQYDEPMPGRWFQRVREELSKKIQPQRSQSSVQTQGLKNLPSKKQSKDSDLIVIYDDYSKSKANDSRVKSAGPPVDAGDVRTRQGVQKMRSNIVYKPQVIKISEFTSANSTLMPMSANYKVRHIRQERQRFRSYIVEERPGCFYHYMKTHTITAECSECREQWRKHGQSGFVGRLVIAESRVMEIVSEHHEDCQPHDEVDIRQLEIRRNVGNAMVIDDDLVVFEKAEQMAQLEIERLIAEEKTEAAADSFSTRPV